MFGDYLFSKDIYVELDKIDRLPKFLFKMTYKKELNVHTSSFDLVGH